MRKKCLANEDCPLARGYNAVGDWWSLLIVMRVLVQGIRRFTDLQQNLGLARNILSARLRKLVAEGILEKVPARRPQDAGGRGAPDGRRGGRQEYTATERGRELYKVLVALQQWGEKEFCGNGGPKFVLADTATGRAIPPIEVRAADGRVLGPDDLQVVARAERKYPVPPASGMAGGRIT